ncbi:hypothetical protein VaNZ11_010487, partial [Volvox africanus]
MLIGGFVYMTSSLLMFQMAFTYSDPLAVSNVPAWHCTDASDSACVTLLDQQLKAHGYQPSIGGGVVTPASTTAGRRRLDSTPNPGPHRGAFQQHMPRNFCDLKPSQYAWNDPWLSLSSEYNLVCDQAWKASLLDTLFFAGFMLGNGVFGCVADRHGRRATLAACAAATAIVTALSASTMVPPGPGSRAAAAAGTAAAGAAQSRASGSVGGGGYWLHLVLRCASGALCAGQALGGYVLATEMVGPTWRGAAGLLTQSFFIFGEFLLVALSLAFPRWRRLTLSISVFCASALLLVPLVPESPRWLLLHAKPDKARAALLWVARTNRVRPTPLLECTSGGEVYLLQRGASSRSRDGGRIGDNTAAAANPQSPADREAMLMASPAQAPPADEYDSVNEGEEEMQPLISGHGATAAGSSNATGLRTALAHPVTRRLLLSSCFVLFSLSVSYYGVTLALGSLVAGSLHLNFFLTAAAELPGYLVLAATTDRIGRRTAISCGTALAGLACLACALTSGGAMQVALAMVGKLGSSGAWAVGLTFAAELFPTSLRSGALSVASQSGDLGGLVAPILLLLRPPGHFERLPFAVMGLMSLTSMALLAKLPETRGMPQLETFEELLEWLRRNDGG